MQKFPKVKYPNDPETDGLKADTVVVTEKLDGANFRFTWDDEGELWIGSRNHEYHHNDENIPKAFRHAIEYLQETVSYEDGYEDYTIFGEAMHLHSLEYEDVEYTVPSSGSAYFDSEPNVICFDAQYDGEWMNWDNVVGIVDDMGLTLTDVLERGHPEELSFDVPDESMFGGEPEGIVARRVDGSVRAKKVTDSFKEKNATAFNDKGKAQTDAGEFVATYVTDARIEKHAHKLIDSGEYEHMEMQMMEDLPRNVLTDVMAEHGWELLTSGSFEGTWDDDFKAEVRSKASTKCARELRSLCQQM